MNKNTRDLRIFDQISVAYNAIIKCATNMYSSRVVPGGVDNKLILTLGELGDVIPFDKKTFTYSRNLYYIHVLILFIIILYNLYYFFVRQNSLLYCVGSIIFFFIITFHVREIFLSIYISLYLKKYREIRVQIFERLARSKYSSIDQYIVGIFNPISYVSYISGLTLTGAKEQTPENILIMICVLLFFHSFIIISRKSQKNLIHRELSKRL